MSDSSADIDLRRAELEWPVRVTSRRSVPVRRRRPWRRDLGVDPACRTGEEGDGLGNVVGGTEAPERRHRGEAVDGVLLLAPRKSGVAAGPGATALTAPLVAAYAA